VESVAFIDPTLVRRVISFELDPKRYRIACASAEVLRKRGLTVNIELGDIFDYTRISDEPHLFFFDLPGICNLNNYRVPLSKMLMTRVIREHDTVLITSHLGHNPGFKKRIFKMYEGEFLLLEAETEEQKREYYRRAHPSFTLHRALTDSGLIKRVCLRPLGMIEYHDTSSMGLYGYAVQPGSLPFRDFIKDTVTFKIYAG
jgi:hypothetical protein